MAKEKWENYYATVKEDSEDLVSEVIDELLEEISETNGFGYSFFNWYSRNEHKISEWNNYLELSLRDSVEILEQSRRLVDDSGMYANVGDCREQVKAMAYWTYRNDLVAEFKIALVLKLEEHISELQAEVEKREQEQKTMESILADKEEQIELLEERVTELEGENEKELQKVFAELEPLREEAEQLESNIEAFEDETSEKETIIDVIEKFIKEI